ncbi:MAG: energy transducer TonB [Marinobacter sp.]|uniref:energy transducer TonB family protein n=1 Tax=Marinobacter sp. TaxID=50741 RepID=UPI00299EABFB|nr:energy transducer TonB [Marinobacter sp.]MDX1754449.1 energy transducer TonB [Marinobacter sp.]
MFDTGSRPPLPAKYRLLLALSVALLLHTLAVSLVPLISLPDDRPAPSALRISLSQPANADNQQARPPAPERPETPVTRPPEPEPVTPVIQSRHATRTVATTQTPPAQPQPSSTTTPRPAPPPPRPAAASPAPSTSPVERTTDQPQEITQLGKPVETSPYLTALAVRIARHARGTFAQALTATLEHGQPAPVEIELHLMGNGALIGATVSRSSGNPVIDRAAYQGALSASPYPPPPEGRQSSNRFRVDIVFTPERL